MEEEPFQQRSEKYDVLRGYRVSVFACQAGCFVSTWDAQAFLVEGKKPGVAHLIEQQACLLGQAQYPAVQRAWSSVATLIEQVATLEERLIALCASW